MKCNILSFACFLFLELDFLKFKDWSHQNVNPFWLKIEPEEFASVNWVLRRACWVPPSRSAWIWGNSKWTSSWSAMKVEPTSRNWGRNQSFFWTFLEIFSWFVETLRKKRDLIYKLQFGFVFFWAGKSSCAFFAVQPKYFTSWTAPNRYSLLYFARCDPTAVMSHGRELQRRNEAVSVNVNVNSDTSDHTKKVHIFFSFLGTKVNQNSIINNTDHTVLHTIFDSKTKDSPPVSRVLGYEIRERLLPMGQEIYALGNVAWCFRASVGISQGEGSLAVLQPAQARQSLGSILLEMFGKFVAWLSKIKGYSKMNWIWSSELHWTSTFWKV